jgi:ABC-2 type transport system ATP-binding protein
VDHAIVFDGVTKDFGKKQVLRGLQLRVPPGTVYALLGRNGSGKSTALRILLGLTAPDQGLVSIMGRSPWLADPSLFAEVGYVSGDRPMYADWTVKAMLDWLGTVHPTWDGRWVAELVTLLRLSPAATIGSLSRGGQASVSMIAALGARPKLLVLDEPTSGLDAWVRRTFHGILATLVKERGMTVIIASHDMPEVSLLSTRVGVLHQGRIEVELSREELMGGLSRVRTEGHAREALGELPPEVLHVRSDENGAALLVRGAADGVVSTLVGRGVKIAGTEPLPVEDLYVEVTDPAGAGGTYQGGLPS